MPAERHRVIPASFVLVYEGEGRDRQVLLHRRKDTGYRDGWYDAPSGHVEPGEMPHVAAARELHEETGLSVADPQDLELFHIVSNDGEDSGSAYIYFIFRIARSLCFGGFSIQEPHKCDDMQLFPVDALPDNVVPQVLQAIEHLGDAAVTFSRV